MKRLFGFLAVAGMMIFAAPVVPAQAVSLINPSAAAQTKNITNDLAVEVRHGGGGFRGGGFHGGGFRGFHGGGRHFGHAHFGGPRFVHHRPFFVRRYAFRPYPYYYAERRFYCRWVITDFGPRKICRYRPWWG